MSRLRVRSGSRRAKKSPPGRCRSRRFGACARWRSGSSGRPRSWPCSRRDALAVGGVARRGKCRCCGERSWRTAATVLAPGLAGCAGGDGGPTSVWLSHFEPLRVLPERRLPADSSLPGHRPAHDSRPADARTPSRSRGARPTPPDARRLPPRPNPLRIDRHARPTARSLDSRSIL